MSASKMTGDLKVTNSGMCVVNSNISQHETEICKVNLLAANGLSVEYQHLADENRSGKVQIHHFMLLQV